MSEESPYVGRGGIKLRHALETFGINPAGWVCADLGSSVGGFTDCLVQGGAARVYAVDTSYGELAWTLRSNERVVPVERANALHAEPPEPVDLVTIDLGWTKQALAVPAALRWLKAGGRVVTLVKPHYELERDQREMLEGGVLPEDEAERVVRRVLEELPALGVRVTGSTRSPILGGRKKGRGTGNAEWLALLERG